MQLIHYLSLLAVAGDVLHAHPLNDSSSTADGGPHQRRQTQNRFNPCPENWLKCSQCGGDSKQAGYCNDLQGDGPYTTGCDIFRECGTHCPCVPAQAQKDNTFPWEVIPGFAALVALALAAPKGFIPPGSKIPPVPQLKKNPGQCPYYEDLQCPDCKGVIGICTETGDRGCPCKSTCPTDDKEKPECNEEYCQGGDGDTGKCTVGTYKGCECKKKKKCPEEKAAPYCTDPNCEGNDEKKCTKGKHENCSCRECPTKEKTPVCTVPECKGEKENKCTEDFNSCACIYIDQPIGYAIPTRIVDAQQRLIKYNAAHPPKEDKQPPFCQHGKHGDREVCKCGKNYGTYYSVAPSSSGSASYTPCPYTTPPGPPLTFPTTTTTTKPPETTESSSSENGNSLTTISKTTVGPVVPNPTGACQGRSVVVDDMEAAIRKFCENNSRKFLKINENVANIAPKGYGPWESGSGLPYSPMWYKNSVSWIENCRPFCPINSDRICDSVRVLVPSPGEDTCESLLRKSFSAKNGGRGGSIDVGCLQYKTEVQCAFDPYKIGKDGVAISPTVPYPADTCKGKDVYPDTLEGFVDKFCKDSNDKNIRQGDDEINNADDIGKSEGMIGMLYNLGVSWVDGCESTLAINVGHPAGPNDERTNCKMLMMSNYYDNVGNKGRGGYRDIGCARFSFHPTC